jgi:hypothetical protein
VTLVNFAVGLVTSALLVCACSDNQSAGGGAGGRASTPGSGGITPLAGAAGLPASGGTAGKASPILGDDWNTTSPASTTSPPVSLVIIDTMGAGEPILDVYKDSTLTFIQGGDTTPPLSSPATFSARAAVRIRGQTSASFDQKSYRVEFRDAAGMDVDMPLGGLPPQSDFALHAPYVDKSLLRNAFVYDLGPSMGLLAPRIAFAELYLNPQTRPVAEQDYRGFYVIIETIKNAPRRLNLEQLDPTDVGLPAIQGGYILKFELDVAEPPLIACNGRGASCFQDLELDDPDPATAEQAAYIQSHVQAFHAALLGQNFADPVAGYAAFVDVQSFVDYFVLQEFVRNLDAYIRSLFLHKSRNGKIVAGPLWDYNLMGGTGLDNSNNPIEGFQYEVDRNGDANGWFQRLMQDPAFEQRVRTRYRELRGGVLSDAGIDARLERLAARLGPAAARHFARWPILTQRQLSFFTGPIDATWEGQVDSLSSWLKRRAAWLDQNL